MDRVYPGHNCPPYQPKWRWNNNQRGGNMEKKDSDYHDNFFASLNQLILSLEPAIKEAGSVSAAEDILAHLEATDENFHRFEPKYSNQAAVFVLSSSILYRRMDFTNKNEVELVQS